MSRLLSANFSRLWKDTVFWITIIGLVVMSVATAWINYQTGLRYDAESVYVEDVMFNVFPIIAFVSAVFISLFLGTEYDDNTIRNKLIVGHTRKDIFFASCLTCIAASVLQMIVMLLVSGIAGWFLYGRFLLPWEQLTFIFVCCTLISAVYAVISVSIGMKISNKAISVVVTLLLMFALLMNASSIQSRLAEPEIIYDSVTITMDGVQYGDLIKNPAYVNGTRRAVYEFLYDFLPSGQTLQLNDMELEACTGWPLFSAGLLIVITAMGYVLFRKKDIK